jgi:hypothetical protein
MEAEINIETQLNPSTGEKNEKTLEGKLLLANGQRVDIQTSTRQPDNGKKSTFVSINTGCFRIKVVQRISTENEIHDNAQIGFSTTSETDNLATIETLSLSLKEAIRIAKELNEKVN